VNDQRKVIFEQRVDWMKTMSAPRSSPDMRHAAVEELVAKHVPENAYPEQWDTRVEERSRASSTSISAVDEWAKEEGIARGYHGAVHPQGRRAQWPERSPQWGPDVMRYVESRSCCKTLDTCGREHFLTLEASASGDRPARLRTARSAQRIQAESFNLFRGDGHGLREAVTAH